MKRKIAPLILSMFAASAAPAALADVADMKYEGGTPSVSIEPEPLDSAMREKAKDILDIPLGGVAGFESAPSSINLTGSDDIVSRMFELSQADEPVDIPSFDTSSKDVTSKAQITKPDPIDPSVMCAFNSKACDTMTQIPQPLEMPQMPSLSEILGNKMPTRTR